MMIICTGQQKVNTPIKYFAKKLSAPNVGETLFSLGTVTA